MTDYKQLYYQDSIGKQIKITDGEICLTGSNIAEGEFSIEQILCDESQLKFGRCIASTMKMQVINNVVSLKNRELTIDHILEGADEPFRLGTYHVESDKPTADRNYRDIIAYDDMEYIRNTEVSGWYEGLVFPMMLKDFRDSFFEWMGIEQEETTLVNDGMIVNRTIEAQELYGETIIEKICEINGCFGHIDFNRIFRYVFLKSTALGVYPSNNLYPYDELFPEDNEGERLDATYKSGMTYEDYQVCRITKLIIRQDSDDIGGIAGDGDNCYVIEDNFLVYGKGDDELQEIAENTFSVIKNVMAYTPINCPAKGNPVLQLGDSISINTTKEMVSSYILSRTLTGVQALNDVYVSKGTEYYTQKTGGKNQKITQLQSRVNRISNTVDGFTQQIQNIITTLDDVPTRTEMNTEISATAQGINIEISKKVGNDEIISKINASAEGLQIDASKIELTGYVTATDLAGNGTTTINGANITTGKVTAEHIDGTNLQITGMDATIQVGASGTENNNYIYMVGYDNGILSEAHIDCKAVSCYGEDGYSFSISRSGLNYSYDDEIYFSVLKNENAVNIGSSSKNMNILSPVTGINTISAYGSYSFSSGGSIYKDGGDRISFADKNVHIENTLSCAGDIELSGNLYVYNKNITGGNVSGCMVDFLDKNGNYKNITLTEAIHYLISII